MAAVDEAWVVVRDCVVGKSVAVINGSTVRKIYGWSMGPG